MIIGLILGILIGISMIILGLCTIAEALERDDPWAPAIMLYIGAMIITGCGTYWYYNVL